MVCQGHIVTTFVLVSYPAVVHTNYFKENQAGIHSESTYNYE